MCLNLRTNKQQQLKIAEKDIVVYKVVALRSSDGIFVSPFQGSRVFFGKVLISGLVKTLCKLFEEESEVHIGFHSFKNKKDASALIEKFWDWEQRYKLAQCIIPKGSKYYEGEFNFIIDSIAYASDSIQYVKIIRRR